MARQRLADAGNDASITDHRKPSNAEFPEPPPPPPKVPEPEQVEIETVEQEGKAVEVEEE